MALYCSSSLFINFIIHPQLVHLRFLRGFPAIFISVICQYLIFFVGSAVIIIRSEVPLPLWSGLDVPYYQIKAACHTHQLKSLSVVHICFMIFWNFHLVVFVPLLTLHVTPPTSDFKQLIYILPCFVPSFRMAFYQVILSYKTMKLYHPLLLLHPLYIHNGLFNLTKM